MQHDYNYLIQLQYLGFRYSGWQVQPNAKTLQLMLEKTLKFILEDKKFKVLAAGRTDAKVSAKNMYVQLYAFEDLDIAYLQNKLNEHLPPDMKSLSVKEIDRNFQIIQDAKTKTYHYYFYMGERFPYAAPFMTWNGDELDIELMQKGANVFVGEHFWKNYCYKPKEDQNLVRNVEACEIVENDILSANFFPKTSFVLKVQGKGFLRHQIRMMMGMLFDLGRGEISIDELKTSLVENNSTKTAPIAPSSGLCLENIQY